MMLKAVSFALILLFASISFVSAQWIESDAFVPVSSAQVGHQQQGCFVASMVSMLASLNDTSIGTNPEPIIKHMRGQLCRPSTDFPYPIPDVVSSAISFLMAVL